MSDYIRVRYLGTNVGKIYLSDVDKRLGLGGAQEGGYNKGQDRYITWGETVVLEETAEVLNSLAKGVLKYYSTPNSDVFKTGAPFVIDSDSAYTLADENPRRDLGAGKGLFTEDYLAKLSNDKWAPANKELGDTGFYYGNIL